MPRDLSEGADPTVINTVTKYLKTLLPPERESNYGLVPSWLPLAPPCNTRMLDIAWICDKMTLSLEREPQNPKSGT